MISKQDVWSVIEKFFDGKVDELLTQKIFSLVQELQTLSSEGVTLMKDTFDQLDESLDFSFDRWRYEKVFSEEDFLDDEDEEYDELCDEADLSESSQETSSPLALIDQLAFDLDDETKETLCSLQETTVLTYIPEAISMAAAHDFIINEAIKKFSQEAASYRGMASVIKEEESVVLNRWLYKDIENKYAKILDRIKNVDERISDEFLEQLAVQGLILRKDELRQACIKSAIKENFAVSGCENEELIKKNFVDALELFENATQIIKENQDKFANEIEDCFSGFVDIYHERMENLGYQMSMTDRFNRYLNTALFEYSDCYEAVANCFDEIVDENTDNQRLIALYSQRQETICAFKAAFGEFFPEQQDSEQVVKEKVQAFYENAVLLASQRAAVNVFAQVRIQDIANKYGVEIDFLEEGNLNKAYLQLADALGQEKETVDLLLDFEHDLITFIKKVQEIASFADTTFDASAARSRRLNLEQYLYDAFDEQVDVYKMYEAEVKSLFAPFDHNDGLFVDAGVVDCLQKNKERTQEISDEPTVKSQEQHSTKTEVVGKSESGIKVTSKAQVNEIIDRNFSDLVGLGAVKNTVAEIVCQKIKAPKAVGSLHLVIEGNAGTGKTTAANRIAQILYETGIIKTDKIIYKTGAGIKGEYVGQTVPAVQKMFKSGRGGTIILDEVYTLASKGKDGDSYTDEAVGALLNELEASRGDTAVIIMGYKEPTEGFLRYNEGLSRRFPYKINIPTYTHDELMQIFDLEVGRLEVFDVTAQARDMYANYLKSAMGREGFSNAGEVRDAVTRITGLQSRMKELDDYVVPVDVVEAFIKEDQEAKRFAGKNSIGFGEFFIPTSQGGSRVVVSNAQNACSTETDSQDEAD